MSTTRQIRSRSRRSLRRPHLMAGNGRAPSLPHRALWNINAQPLPFQTAGRPQDGRVHTFTQTIDNGALFTTSTTIPTSAGAAFSLASNLTQFASYTALFDQYRIDKIEVWLNCPTLNSVGGGNWFSAVDYDSASASLTPAQILQYGNVLSSPIINGHYHAWKPHVAVGAYSGSVFTGFKNEVASWIDCGSTTVQHYGLAVVAEATPTAAEVINILTRLTVSFRNVV
jgi:hypothetical protein